MLFTLNNLEVSIKKQFIARFNHLTYIKEEDIKLVKYSTEYLNNINMDIIYDIVAFQKEKPSVLFKEGLTKEDCLLICKLHDKPLIDNVRHPITFDQSKLNESNKEKQKKVQEDKKYCIRINITLKIMILVNMYKRLKHNIIILLGLFMLGIFIYFRFIRERLPKDIPFKVTSLDFIIIVAVCLLYCYLVWITIKTKKNSNKAVQISFNFIVKPLEDFDTFIKQISIIKLYYTLFIIWLVYTFEYIFKHLLFDYLFYILPRIVLLTAFIIDTVYFHKLFYIYKVLLIGILLFLRRYILYTVKKLKQDCIHDLQHDILGISTDYVAGVHPSEWPENKTDDDRDDILKSLQDTLAFISFIYKN